MTGVPAGIRCELIVVDNASTDHTREVVEANHEANMPCRYLREDRRGKAFALNTGITEANGDILLFTDDDVSPPYDCAASYTPMDDECTSHYAV
jgi:glycosyltransferase involved in cell wall biosynthesis